MPENLNPNETTHDDDELARFANRVIDGERPEVPDMEGKDRELAELMQTVVSLERTLNADLPDPAMARRIRANLLKEWEKSGPVAERGSFWARLWSGREAWSSPRQRQITGLAMAIGTVALVLFGFTLLSPGGTSQPGPGSGGGFGLSSDARALIVGGLVVLAGVLWWLGRPRR